MEKIKIFADSTCDLSPELIEQHDIGIVPLNIIFGDDIFQDGVDITTKELYEKVEKYKCLPKTSAASPGVFKTAFEPYINKGYNIIYISISSELSATYQNAILAAGMFDEGRIEIVDSRNLSTGIGILVLNAVDLKNQGFTAKEIAQKISELTSKVETEFVIDTLDYLYKGGRCNSVQRFAGGLLKIRPAIKVIDGKMTPSKKFRGKREKVLDAFFDHVMGNVENIDKKRVIVTHSQGLESALYLKEKIAQKFDVEEILVTEAGCVISSHCGQNTVGIIYIHK
ncbi:EDD domain protein, DegV family [Anaerobranca californiensis DSM 14826]|uniref:EDD domain protein, DegV family n=1 Tax=Anaerobranca californiensis DSM 14826 TaxID=1120989 RepID=A0A1M6LLV6_9FIRM|nr:DegV family protein [Anaerobranca californiensis]SHJ72143.1 EDD domain protein, DegV family [Anaerobranca californiensis DSM 14826]